MSGLHGIRDYFKKMENKSSNSFTKSILNFLRFLRRNYWTAWCKIQTPIKKKNNRSLSPRKLEIGPGGIRLPGFETVNIVGGKNVDYIMDASKELKFNDNSFQLIYASHILEHIPWYKTKKVLLEWVRILKPGGKLEVWVPDGIKICQVFIEIDNGQRKEAPDNWDILDATQDPYLWVNGHIFYGARSDYPSWHHAIFSSDYLTKLFHQIGLENIRIMDPDEVRGEDHGWINLGVKGTKV